MLNKHQDDAGAVIVTLRIPPEAAAETAAVAGDFNDWSTSTHEMTRDDDGFSIDLRLEAGRRYRFRYYLDGRRWENDWAADAYVANEFGGDDSVIDLTELDGHRNGGAASAATKPAKARSTRRNAKPATSDA